MIGSMLSSDTLAFPSQPDRFPPIADIRVASASDPKRTIGEARRNPVALVTPLAVDALPDARASFCMAAFGSAV